MHPMWNTAEILRVIRIWLNSGTDPVGKTQSPKNNISQLTAVGKTLGKDVICPLQSLCSHKRRGPRLRIRFWRSHGFQLLLQDASVRHFLPKDSDHDCVQALAMNNMNWITVMGSKWRLDDLSHWAKGILLQPARWAKGLRAPMADWHRALLNNSDSSGVW